MSTFTLFRTQRIPLLSVTVYVLVGSLLADITDLK